MESQHENWITEDLCRSWRRWGEQDLEDFEWPPSDGGDASARLAGRPGGKDQETPEESLDEWVLAEEPRTQEAGCGTWQGGPEETAIHLSRSLATAFLIADIGIQITCLDQLISTTDGDRTWITSCQRFFDALCHAVDADDRWRVETAMACLEERLQLVATLSGECSQIVAILVALLRRLQGRCLRPPGASVD